MEMMNTLEDAVQERVAEIAYGKSEARGFANGQEQQDWQEAQQQVAGELQADLEAIRSGLCQCITPLEQALHQRIAKVAYGFAQERGFAPGHEMEDWHAAEEQVTLEVQTVLPGMTVEQGARGAGEMLPQHNEVEKGWESPAETEIPAMNPD